MFWRKSQGSRARRWKYPPNRIRRNTELRLERTKRESTPVVLCRFLRVVEDWCRGFVTIDGVLESLRRPVASCRNCHKSESRLGNVPRRREANRFLYKNSFAAADAPGAEQRQPSATTTRRRRDSMRVRGVWRHTASRDESLEYVF